MTAQPAARAAVSRNRSVAPPAGHRPKEHRRPRPDTAAALGFLAPAVLLMALFVFLPLGRALVLSLERTNGFGAGTFIGPGNYTRLVADPVFWRAAANTVLFTVIVTPAAMAVGLGAAVLLNSALPARGVFRSILILPMAISGVATALLGLLVFDQNTGILDKLVRAIGLPAVNWQSGSVAAFASIVLVTLWWRIGFNMLIYLAALQAITPELFEAARLDGASRWQRLTRLTVPLVAPASFFLLVVNVVYSFQVFDIVFVMTGGGPQNATSVLVTYAYDNGFGVRDQGYAAAIGVVLLLTTGAFTALQWRLNRSRDATD